MWRAAQIYLLLPFCTDPGLYRSNSIQGNHDLSSDVVHNSRKTPSTTNTSELHGKPVVVDAALLGPRSLLTAKYYGSVADPSHPVSLPISSRAHYLPLLLSDIQRSPRLEAADYSSPRCKRVRTRICGDLLQPGGSPRFFSAPLAQ